MLSKNEQRRKRYAEDPEYRARILAANSAYNEAHKTTLNKRRRERMATDLEHRERCLARRRGAPARRSQLKLYYGLSLEEYNALLALQNGVCAICEEKSDRTLCVDHCHLTRLVRGLLCRRCNLGLGYFRDDPRLLLKAVLYLRHARRAPSTNAQRVGPARSAEVLDQPPRNSAVSLEATNATSSSVNDSALGRLMPQGDTA
jgi:Autographiviridae endonuclease VII